VRLIYNQLLQSLKHGIVENILMILGVEHIGALLNQNIQQGYDPHFMGVILDNI
jgi:hypothetical protein